MTAKETPPENPVQPLYDNQIHLYLIPLTASPSRLNILVQRLNQDEIARGSRLIHAHHRSRWLTGRARLKSILAGYCNIEPRSVQFAPGLNGKPDLLRDTRNSAETKKLFFNFSHSGEVALLAITTIAPIGADIEHKREIRDWPAVTRRFFSTREQDQLNSLDKDLQRHAFYTAWTRKEAIIKATGEGLTAKLGAFDVTLTPDTPPAVLLYQGVAAPHHRWQLCEPDTPSGYVGAVAIQSPALLELKQWNYQDSIISV